MVQTVHREKTPPRTYVVVRAIWWAGESLQPGATLVIDDPTVASDLCHIGRIRLLPDEAPAPAAAPQSAAPPDADAAPARERAPRKPRSEAAA